MEDIEEIIEMRNLLLRKGIEIYLKNGKSYIFNFLTTLDYDNFKNNLEKNNKLKYLLRKKNFLSDKTIITKNWTKSLLSNFDYLLYLNRYSSRSYNDPGQYPRFPWLLFLMIFIQINLINIINKTTIRIYFMIILNYLIPLSMFLFR